MLDFKSARQYFQDKKHKTYYDKVFVKLLVKKVQKMNPEVGAFIFPDQLMLVFFYRKIIIDKIILNEENLERIPFENHVTRIKEIIKMLSENKIPLYDMQQLQAANKGFNSRKTGHIVT